VKVTAKLMGIVDTEVLEYHWGPNWDAEPTDRQHGLHVEYTLQPEGGGTRVRFDITLEPSAPVLEFLIKRGEKIVLDDATEGLGKRVLASRLT
jgi:uncharacterized protein YndB with AHSA1/START domain